MVIALDLGSSSVRATLYDARGRAVDGRFHQVPYAPVTTRDGGVEHDPTRLLGAAATCLDAVVRAARHEDLRAVAVTSFWHGLIGFDTAHRPVTPVFMWADSRSTREAGLPSSAGWRASGPPTSAAWPAGARSASIWS